MSDNTSKQQFDTLYRISQLLNSADHPDHLIRESLDLVIQALQADRAVFVARSADGEPFSVLAARNNQGADLSDPSDFSRRLVNQVLDERRPLLYHDVQSDPNVSQFESVQIQQIQSVIGVPIFSEDEIRGVILADSRTNRSAFTRDNLDFLGFFSTLVSLALDKLTQLQSLRDENQLLKHRIHETEPIPDLIGQSAAMQRVSRLIHRVAESDVTVLLLGESGTGKDIVARALHRLSRRRQAPFLAQFCGSIPDTLLESELFGYRKGAFSGATADKKGLFEVASSGTFFLDEIGDVPLSVQSKLLRVLENNEIMRVGDTQVRTVDVRIIAATHRDLNALVKSGEFRQDLFYRLNVFPIQLPPLRVRHGDIPLLARHFVSKHADHPLRLHPSALKRLESYHWPGNVRELENILKRATILCEDDTILPEHIVIESHEDIFEFKGTLKDFGRKLLLRRLQEFDGNRTAAARSLGVSVRWIQIQLKSMDQQSTDGTSSK
jgi:Nif-specific regulatory protein